MWNLNPVVREDLQQILRDDNIPWHRLDGRTVLISGATGLIGRTLTNAILAYGQTVDKPPRVVALVRSPEKAAAMFREQLDRGDALALRVWRAEEPLDWCGETDYIVHCASQTSSMGFVEQPVETIATAYLGTDQLLRLARDKESKGFVYLSSMEVYGTPGTDEKIPESRVGLIDPLTVRNCYPESKRLCESLCAGYASEYRVPATIARLTQTFGPGVQPEDRRVFAEFARKAMSKENIVLHTKGETKRNYVYTADAVRAILTILLRGAPGQAYNVANEDTYCTIYEMACMVAQEVAGGEIRVRCEPEESLERYGYAPVLHMNLDCTRLKALGWKPQVGLREMFERMIAAF